jgi:hypothetical protein
MPPASPLTSPADPPLILTIFIPNGLGFEVGKQLCLPAF